MLDKLAKKLKAKGPAPSMSKLAARVRAAERAAATAVVGSDQDRKEFQAAAAKGRLERSHLEAAILDGMGAAVAKLGIKNMNRAKVKVGPAKGFELKLLRPFEPMVSVDPLEVIEDTLAEILTALKDADKIKGLPDYGVEFDRNWFFKGSARYRDHFEGYTAGPFGMLLLCMIEALREQGWMYVPAKEHRWETPAWVDPMMSIDTAAMDGLLRARLLAAFPEHVPMEPVIGIQGNAVDYADLSAQPVAVVETVTSVEDSVDLEIPEFEDVGLLDGPNILDFDVNLEVGEVGMESDMLDLEF